LIYFADLKNEFTVYSSSSTVKLLITYVMLTLKAEILRAIPLLPHFEHWTFGFMLKDFHLCFRDYYTI